MAFPWLAIASTGLSAFSSIQSGRVKAGQALQSAKLALIDRSLMDTEAKQTAIFRMEQFENDMSTNENMFANLGRADDPSMQAFFDNQKDIVSEDIRLASSQSQLQMRKIEMEAASLRFSSKNILKAATVGALGDVASGISSYQSSKPKSKSTPKTKKKKKSLLKYFRSP